MMLKTGTKMAHIPYPAGTRAIVTAMISGDANVFINETGSMRPFVADGRIRVLAILGNKRSFLYPNTPAISEVGVPELSNAFFPVFFGVFTVPGVPAQRIDALASMVNLALTRPDTVERMKKMGYAPDQLGGTTPQEFRTIVNDSLTTFQNVVRDAQIEKQ